MGAMCRHETFDGDLRNCFIVKYQHDQLLVWEPKLGTAKRDRLANIEG